MNTLQRIQADIEAKRREISELEIAAAVLTRYEREDGRKELVSGGLIGAANAVAAQQAAATLAERIMKSAVEILSSGQALHTAELLVPVCAKIGQTITQEYLSTVLSRNKEEFGLQVTRRQGWSIKPPEAAERAELTPVGEQSIAQETEVKTDDHRSSVF